jgi:hypothetical protein
VGAPEHRVLGDRLVAELGGVRLAEDHGARRLQAAHRDGILLGHEIGEQP